MVPAEPCDAAPCAGTTLRTEPFHVMLKYFASLGHDWSNGPPLALDIAHAVPAAGELLWRSWYSAIAVVMAWKSTWQAEMAASCAPLAALWGTVVVVGDDADVVLLGEAVGCNVDRAIATITPRMMTTAKVPNRAKPPSVEWPWECSSAIRRWLFTLRLSDLATRFAPRALGTA